MFICDNLSCLFVIIYHVYLRCRVTHHVFLRCRVMHHVFLRSRVIHRVYLCCRALHLVFLRCRVIHHCFLTFPGYSYASIVRSFLLHGFLRHERHAGK